MHDKRWTAARGSSQRSSATTLSDIGDRRSVMSASSGGTLVDASMKTAQTSTGSANLRKSVWE